MKDVGCILQKVTFFWFLFNNSWDHVAVEVAWSTHFTFWDLWKQTSRIEFHRRRSRRDRRRGLRKKDTMKTIVALPLIICMYTCRWSIGNRRVETYIILFFRVRGGTDLKWNTKIIQQHLCVFKPHQTSSSTSDYGRRKCSILKTEYQLI